MKLVSKSSFPLNQTSSAIAPTSKLKINFPPNFLREKDSKKEECKICLYDINSSKIKTLPCKHRFHETCVNTALKVNNLCPICKQAVGKVKGNQPHGTMIHRTQQHTHLPGYERYDAIVIDYHFPSGIQGPEHPNPGVRYTGTSRTAYLPDNYEGREVLRLLKKAFAARLIFTIGRSVTTGMDNQVTWNDIHHKTNPYGGATRFGYPDSDYLNRVKDELKAKGIQ
ncbi:putative E3 ubiquitin-protein ligase DTX3 [Ciona intestinalis]